MNARRLIAPWVTAVAMSSCAATSSVSSVAAKLSADAASHAALLAAVREATGNANVVLADDALTRTSRLVLEPTPRHDANGRLLQGRETRPPEVFQLRQRGKDCVLVHEGSQQEFVLSGASCSAE